MKQLFQYNYGHSLSFADYGDKNGYPVLVQHGLIASIGDAHLFDHLINSGVRVICIARPGYGDSSPYAMSNIAEWGDIVSSLVDELKLARFDVMGMSSGAPYSYAIGYRLPEKARNLYIFSGIPALYDQDVLAVWPYPVDRNAETHGLQKLAHDLFFTNMPQDGLISDDIIDSMRNDCFGIALDFKLRCNPWGFVLSGLKEQIYMQHSKTDNLAAAEITANLLPHCHLDIRENGDHFSTALLDQFIKTTVLPNLGKDRPT
jgi:pimeloyl-ACP methyl ester carboxylesterase